MTIRKHIILLLLSIIFIANSFAQKQKTKPINSGFVFIDSKYIEPPYVIEKIENTLLINNIIIKTIPKLEKIKKFKTIKTFPDYLPDTMNEYYAIMNYINPKNGHSFREELISYYIYKYGEENAGEYLKKFYNKMINVDSLYKDGRIWKLKLKGREKPMMYLWTYNHKKYISNLKNFKKYHSKKVKYLLNCIERYEKNLTNNKVIFFTKDRISYNLSVNQINSVINIINNKISVQDKSEQLKNINVNNVRNNKDFLQNKIVINNNFTERLKKMEKENK